MRKKKQTQPLQDPTTKTLQSHSLLQKQKTDHELEETKRRQRLEKIVQDGSEALFIAEGLAEKIWKKVLTGIQILEIDKRRTPFQVELTVEEILTVTKQYFFNSHDEGEIETFQDQWALTEEDEEPKPVDKDTVSMSGRDYLPMQELKVIESQTSTLPFFYPPHKLLNTRQASSQLSLDYNKPPSRQSIETASNQGGNFKRYGTIEVEEIKKKAREKKEWVEQVLQKRKFFSQHPEGYLEHVKITQPQAIEVDDFLENKIRQEKLEAKAKFMYMYKMKKDSEVKQRQRQVEIDMKNKELAKGSFTFDYEGNPLIQQSVKTEFLPQDFKFKFNFKDSEQKTKSPPKNIGTKSRSKKIVENFINPKNLLQSLPVTPMDNMQVVAGSNFETMEPSKAGVTIREKRRMKHSQMDFDEATGKMTVQGYKTKVSDGNFVSANIQQELLDTKHGFRTTGLLSTTSQKQFQTRLEHMKLKDSLNQQNNRNFLSTQQMQRSKNIFQKTDSRSNIFMQEPGSLKDLIEIQAERQLFSSQAATRPSIQIPNDLQQSLDPNNEAFSTQFPMNNYRSQFQSYKRSLQHTQTQDLQSLKSDVLQRKTDELNLNILKDFNWGSKASIKAGMRSTKAAGTGLIPVGRQSRPFSRATLGTSQSQQSVRVKNMSQIKRKIAQQSGIVR